MSLISRRKAIATAGGLLASLAWGGLRASAGDVSARVPSSGAFDQDLLVINARAITLDPTQPVAEAILIKDGRIAFVGSTADARARGWGIPVFDAAGRTAIPGFIDGHTHLEWFSESFSFHTQLPADLRSLKDMFAILRRAAAETPAGHWVIGRGNFGVYTQVVEKRLATRQELDAISTDHPIVLFSSVHEASLNTPAFKVLGLWTEHEQLAMKWKNGRPRIGSLVYRDGAGVPTGVVTEIYDLILDQPLFPFADRAEAYGLRAREDYAPKGITTIVNMSGQPDHIRADQQAQRRGELPLRIRMFHIVPNADILDRMTSSHLRRGDGDDMYRFAGVKVFVDGDGDDGTGREITDLKWNQQQLDQTVLRCNLAGYPMVFHVVTKGGFDLALNALAFADSRAPRGLRHQIHHLGILLANPTDRARVKALKVTLGLTRADHGGQWPEEIDYRGLLDEGIPAICVSDSAGSFRHFSALEGIASLVAPPGEGGVLKSGRTVSFDEALRMWTTTAAYANYEEHAMGSISIGKLGDLSLLSRDPRTLKGGELFDLKVETVVLGGRVVFNQNAA
jgi:hypothetical protein